MNDGKFNNYLPTGMTVKDTTRRMEILDMCWDYSNEEKVCENVTFFGVYTIKHAVQIYIGLKNGYVQCFDVTSKGFTGQFDATGGTGQLVGIERHKKLKSL